MQVELKTFRDAGALPSGLAWNPKAGAWLCGDDFGNVMIYSEEKDSFEGFNACDSSINFVAVNSGGNICALGFNDSLNLREFPKVNNVIKDTLLRRELAPTHAQFDNSDSLVFVSSLQEDILIHSVDGSNNSTKVSTNGKAVRSFTLSPSNAYIGVVDVEGTVKVFSLKFSDKKISSIDLLTEKFDLVAKKVSQCSAVGSDFGCKVSWYPNEARKVLLAAPSVDGSIVLLSDAKEWNESFLTCDESNAALSFGKGLPVSMVQFSPSGDYLASCDTAGNVILWSMNVDQLKACQPVKKISTLGSVPLIDLMWGQSDSKINSNYLMLLGKDTYSRVDNVIAANNSTTAAVAEDVAAAAPVSALQPRKRLTKPGNRVEFRLDNNTESAAPAASHDDDDDNLFDDEPTTSTSTTVAATPAGTEEVDSVSIRQIKIAALQRSRVVEDETDKPTDSAAGDDLMYDSDDDALDRDNQTDSSSAPLGLSEEELLKLANKLNTSGSSMPLQEAFQPAATKPDDKARSYLVWNSIGNITTREEAVENRVEIRFSNTMGNNKNEAFADRTGFTKASLSMEGAIFASEKETEDESNRRANDYKRSLPGSTVYYHAFSNQKQLEGVNESFRLTLPDNEGVTAVAVGKGWCAVSTDARQLRIFSSTGLQVKVLCLSGPVVTLCGFDSTLAVVYHAGLPVDETFNLKVDLFEVNWREGCSVKSIVSAVSVPLSRKSHLSWIGFEVDLSLLTLQDSNGVFYTLSRCFNAWEWLSVLEVEKVKKSVDHVYWPVMVKNGKLAYVLLNGESKPQVYPQPVTHSRVFSMNLITPPEVKEGSSEANAVKERLSLLLWEELKTRHCEAIKEDISRLGVFAAGYDNGSFVEKMLSKQELETDKIVLKMLQDACKLNQIPLALNLALKLRTEVALAGAIKVANNLGRVTVASALDAMLRHKQMMNSMLAEQQAAEQYTNQGDVEYVGSSSDYQYSYEAPQAEEKKNQLSTKLSNNTNSNSATSGLPPSGRLPSKSAATVVSPSSDANNAAKSSAVVLNPFAVSGSTPVKRKSPLESVVDLNKETPSPKKLKLNRQSSFSNDARAQKNSDKSFL